LKKVGPILNSLHLPSELENKANGSP
jgi:hypothetical protein